MNPLMSPYIAVIYLIIFAIGMIAVTVFFGRRVGSKSIEGFLVADRQIPWWLGGTSIAASWTWAIALMISVQMAYQQGIAGIFWFTVPNIIAVLVYIWLGPKIRERLPKGYSLPEWMHFRFSSKNVTYLYLFVYFYYQIMAAAVQIYAGGTLLSAASGIPVMIIMPAVLITALIYTIISGIEASIVTDFIQLALMLVIGIFTVNLVIGAANGNMNFIGVTEGGGINPFSLQIILTFGVIQSIGLISGSIGDQQFWQRCFAIRKRDVRRSFVFGAILFAAIPISMAFLGFTAAAPEVGLQFPANVDASLVGFAIVKHLLPAGIATVFLFILLAGLSSTLDSALTASSSLYALVHQKPWANVSRSPRPFSIKKGRMAMLLVGIIGLLIGYLVEITPGFDLKYLWWFLNTIGACVVVPTILSLFWGRLTARGILLGSLIGIICGLPLVIYGSIAGNDYILSATYAGVVLVSAISCVIMGEKKE